MGNRNSSEPVTTDENGETTMICKLAESIGQHPMHFDPDNPNVKQDYVDLCDKENTQIVVQKMSYNIISTYLKALKNGVI